MPGNERLTLEIEARTVGEAAVERLAGSLDKVVDISNRAGGSGGNAGRALGEGFEHSVPQIAAASAAIREFEGTLPIRAVERFLTTTLGLGPALSVIFPLVGGLAFADMLGKVAEKYDPLIKAQTALSESNKKLNAEWSQIEKTLEGLQARALTAQFGDKAGSSLKAFFAESDARSFDATAASKQREIDAATRKLATGGEGSFFPGVIGEELTKRSELAAQAHITQLTNERDMALSQANAARQATATDKLEAGSADRKRAAEEAKRAGDERAERGRRISKIEADAAMPSLGPGSKVYAENADIGNEKGMTDSDRARLNAAAGVKTMNVFMEGFQKSVADFTDPTTNGNAAFSRTSEELANRQAEADKRTSDEADRKDKESQSKLDEWVRRSDAANFGTMRDSTQQRARLAGIGARPEDELSVAAQQLNLRVQELAQEREIINAHQTSYDLTVEQSRLERESNDAVLDYLDKLRAARAKQEEQFRSVSGSLFDAMLGGQKGVSGFFRSTGTGIAKTVFENATTLIKPEIEKIIPRISNPNSLPGKLLSGTPFGADPLKGATDLNTLATQDNSAIMRELSAILSRMNGGDAPSGGATIDGSPDGLSVNSSPWTSTAAGIAGASGIPQTSAIAAFASKLPGIFSSATRLGSFNSAGSGVDSSLIAGADPDAINEITSDTVFPSGSPIASAGLKLGTTAGDLAAGAAAIGGIAAAIKGFGGSGAGGINAKLDGTAGIAGAMGAILPMLSSSLAIAGPIGMAIGAALPMIASFIPNGPQHRANQIWKTLTQDTYQAPTALNETMTTNGNYAAIDSRGNLIQTGFSARPQVTDPYIFWGPHNTPVQAPGNVTSPYSPQSAVSIPSGPSQPAPQVHLHIHAIDTQTGADFIMKNGPVIGAAVSAHLQNGDTQLSNTIRNRVMGGR